MVQVHNGPPLSFYFRRRKHNSDELEGLMQPPRAMTVADTGFLSAPNNAGGGGPWPQ